MRSLLATVLLSASFGCNCGPGGTGNDSGVRLDGGAGGGQGGQGGQGGGTGGQGTGGGTIGNLPDGGCEPGILAIVRDFQEVHPDFEDFLGSKRGIVQSQLGVDSKPLYGPEPATAPIVTSGQANFDQWYRDVAGVNLTFRVNLPLSQPQPGRFVYDNSNFFPLDGRGFGDEGHPHNFHFTTEIHGRFVYKGGEVFTFRGDDDVFVFVNGRLALDLGGVHGVEQGSISFDQQASSLGITRGQSYTLDVFHAERHTTQSNFRVETTIECLTPVEIQ